MSVQKMIGSIIDHSDEIRDAVHVAVVAVTAGQTLQPGQRVGIEDGRAIPTARAIGIVDPFLTEPVNKRERFWLFMMPDTVTDLRHSWTHHALPDEDSEPRDDDGSDECAGC